jgi:uncharacterized cupin superfamily protein
MAERPERPNLLDPAWEYEALQGDGIARAARLGRDAGAKRLGATLYELEAGAFASPLHFHHGAEEILFVIAGEPTLRTGAGAEDERTLAPGEAVRFPPGREGTHQILNRGEQPVRVLVCSTNDLPEVAEQVETGLTVVLTREYDRLYRDGVDIDRSGRGSGGRRTGEGP